MQFGTRLAIKISMNTTYKQNSSAGKNRTKKGKGLTKSCQGIADSVHEEMIQNLHDELQELKDAGQDVSFVELKLENLIKE